MSATKQNGLAVSSSEVIASVLLFAAILVGFVLVTSEASGTPKPSIEIEQCSNLGSTCDSSDPRNWQKGNLGTNNSDYSEGQSVPYRSVLSGLSAGQTYVVRIEWDTTEGGKHALDYLTNFNRTVLDADPCAVELCSGASDTLEIPLDPKVSADMVIQIGSQVFDLWGGTFVSPDSEVPNNGDLCGGSTCTISSNPSAYSHTGDDAGSSQSSIEVYFSASAATAVLAWGGHISSQGDWGSSNSAIDLPGSPYHMRLTDLRCSDVENCSTGKKDLSLSTSSPSDTSSTSSSSTSTSTTSTSTSSTSTSSTSSTSTSSSTSSTSTTSSSNPSTSTSTSTSSVPTPTTLPGLPILPAEVTTTSPAPTTVSTTTEPIGEVVVLPAEIATDSTLPSTGSSSRSMGAIGLLLLATGGLGLVLLAIRSTTTKERNS